MSPNGTKSTKIYKKKKDYAKGSSKTGTKGPAAPKTTDDAPVPRKRPAASTASDDIDKKKHKPAETRPPKNDAEISSNWKQLSQQLGPSNSKNKRRTIISNKNNTMQDKLNEIDKADIWFDDVDISLVEKETGLTVIKPVSEKEKLTKLVTGTFEGPTKHIAIDCEMVGVGVEGKKSALARVAIVNSFGQPLYDKFVKPKQFIADYRTHVSGVTPEDMEDASEFSEVQKEVFELMKDRILVGHSLSNDLRVLMLSHPKHMIRDTCKYKEFRKITKGRTPSLKKLTQDLLGLTIQEGIHSPIEDARCAMAIYNHHKNAWEAAVRKIRKDKKAKANAHS